MIPTAQGSLSFSNIQELRRLAVIDGSLGSLSSCRLTLAFKQWPRDWQAQPWVAGRAEGGALREVREGHAQHGGPTHHCLAVLTVRWFSRWARTFSLASWSFSESDA